MSVPTDEQASKFLAPLKGGLTVLLMHEAQAKLPMSRFILGCTSLRSIKTTVLDTDAFYCSNMDRLVDKDGPKGELLLLPEGDFHVSSLLTLLSSKSELLIIDDLNSLYSLASDSRKSQELTILMKLISLNARLNNTWALTTAYRADFEKKQGVQGARSLALLGDLLVDTKVDADSVILKGAWAEERFVLRA